MTRPFPPSFPARPGSAAQPKLQGGPAVPPVRFGQAPQVPSAYLGGAPVQRKTVGPQVPAAGGRATGVVQPKLAQPGPPPRVGPPAVGGQRAPVQPKLAGSAAPQVRAPGPPMPAHQATRADAVQRHPAPGRPAPVVPGAVFGRAIQRMKRGPETSGDERASKQPKTVAEQDWPITADQVWTIFEAHARQKYMPRENESKTRIEKKREEPINPIPNFENPFGITIDPPNNLLMTQNGEFEIGKGGIYQFVADVRVGFAPQLFKFAGEPHLTSSQVKMRSKGLGAKGKQEYEELYIETGDYSSAYEKFIPELKDILLVGTTDIRDSKAYLDWELKSILLEKYGTKANEKFNALSTDKMSKVPGYTAYSQSGSANTFSDVWMQLSPTTIKNALKELKVTMPKFDPKERLRFRTKTFTAFPSVTPVGTVTKADETDLVRTMRRLAKGTHSSSPKTTAHPSIQSEALVKAMAIMGVGESFRAPTNLAHLLVQFGLIKHKKLDFDSLSNEGHWVPRKSEVSSELAQYWDKLPAKLQKYKAPKLMKPFKEHLIEYLKLKATTNPKISVGSDGAVNITAADPGAAGAILRSFFDAHIHKHL